jgi:hypothetical protein
MKVLAVSLFLLAGLLPCLGQNVFLHGDLRQWHKVNLSVEGPSVNETNSSPNPFTDYRFNVTFRHESGSPEYVVPGYFAADGNAAHTSAGSGKIWRAHLCPDKPGEWRYTIEFRKGKDAAIDEDAKTEVVQPLHRRTGYFKIDATNKKAPDFRARGRLEYVDKRYLKFAGSGEYFLKFGTDSPESLLAYTDFDGTRANTNNPSRQGEAAPAGLHKYQPHVKDWKEGDPSWREGKGKGLIGALNYLSSKGVNAISFLTYNAGGDGDNVWPFISRDDKFHYDCSKLEQWQIVFDHAQKLGLHLHFKLQETEMDDNRFGHERQSKSTPSLDGGALGRERRLYLRELIARFGYALALNWNLGEENTQSPEEQRAMAQYIREFDPYPHNIVIHTFPDEQDRVYTALLGTNSVLTGASLQNNWNAVHERTLKWVKASAGAGRPWVVANDEQGPADLGVPADPGYNGFNGNAEAKEGLYNLHDIRKYTLWANLMAGGAGVEYYFGYKLPQNDLGCEDFRSRDKSWEYGRIALDFFRENKIPFHEMENADQLIGNTKNDNSAWCFAKEGAIYLVYLPKGGSAELNLGKTLPASIHVLNPRQGGKLLPTQESFAQGAKVLLKAPATAPEEDWLFVVKTTEPEPKN